MKSPHQSRLFGALLLIGGLTLAFDSQALPPRKHAARGAIESIDPTNRTLTLVSTKNGERQIFVWNNSTRFRQDGKKVTHDSLQPGMAVKGYYRREVGRLVLRELRWVTTSHPAAKPPGNTVLKMPRRQWQMVQGSRQGVLPMGRGKERGRLVL